MAAAAAACLSLALFVGSPSAAVAATSEGFTPSAAHTLSPGFDDEASQFNVFDDCHPVIPNCPNGVSITNVASPSETGDALQFSYGGGNNSYEGLYGAHNFKDPNSDAATRYQINYDFYVPNTAPVQALEFPMNNYIHNKRYQWAMQWEKNGSNTGVPQWRLWNGTAWQSVGVNDAAITANTWYTLTIDGDIVNGQVHYMDFIIHGATHDLSQYTFAPTNATGDGGLQAAMQLDGDSNADPYTVYYDNCHFYWA